MLHTHSLGRAQRLYAEWDAFASEGRRTTFRQLHARVAGLAAALRRRGFEAGDRLAVLLPNGRDYAEIVYACAWLGVIAVPLNTRLSPAEIDRVLTDAAPRGLIRHSSFPAPSVGIPWQVVLDEQPLSVGDDLPPEPVYDPEAILALVYTSGTTGHPKGVVVTHANVLANVHHLNYWLPFRERGVYLHAAPMFHILDLPFLFAAPAAGTCQVTIPKFIPRAFCEAIQRERVTLTVVVPTMIAMLIEFSEIRSFDLWSLTELAYGGSPMAPELIHRVRRALPHVALIQGYGMSEAGFLTGLRDSQHTEDRLLSCGRTCPGIELRVVDETGQDAAVGRPGELTVRGANVMRGYWNNPEETAQALRDGMLRTGDVGYVDPDGFVYILDRLKDMIVTGGENVYSGEVEAALYAHPSVLEAAVFGIPDARWGEVVMACVVRRPGSALSAEVLASHCRHILAGYKVPRRFDLSDTELPKSGSGKILKRLLRERFWTQEGRAVR